MTKQTFLTKCQHFRNRYRHHKQLLIKHCHLFVSQSMLIMKISFYLLRNFMRTCRTKNSKLFKTESYSQFKILYFFNHEHEFISN